MIRALRPSRARRARTPLGAAAAAALLLAATLPAAADPGERPRGALAQPGRQAPPIRGDHAAHDRGRARFAHRPEVPIREVHDRGFRPRAHAPGRLHRGRGGPGHGPPGLHRRHRGPGHVDRHPARGPRLGRHHPGWHRHSPGLRHPGQTHWKKRHPHRHHAVRHGGFCRPCRHHFVSLRRFLHHLEHHHGVPGHALGRVLVRIDVGWLFRG